MGLENQKTESSSCATTASQQTTEAQDNLIHPKELSNPVLESSSRRRLHRELLVSHRWKLIRAVILSSQYEQEELRRRQELQNTPEFVRVRDNLRHITITGH
ncbi:actin-associated protein FAM107A [Garra rufa]|uniref:actin-associated protein FAM107A n=1 Tax=Garra rufa TaxID=137080 RepID=UPI003CCEDA2E